MPRRRSDEVPEAIVQLQVRLDQWRSAQKGRTKLPESFWLAAVDLANQYGVFRTAHTLRLDYARLKKRLGNSVDAHRKPPQAAFVELMRTLQTCKSASSSSSPLDRRRCAFSGSPPFRQIGKRCCAHGGKWKDDSDHCPDARAGCC
jgi:hypothetical protein